MRISILVTDSSANKIQAILGQQPLATQATVARQAFELGLDHLLEGSAGKQARLDKIKEAWLKVTPEDDGEVID